MAWKKKTVFAVVLFVSPLWADTTYTYVALNQYVPKLQDILDQGTKGSKQPLYETKIFIPPNTTSYTQIQITPMNSISDQTLKNLEQAGVLLKISEDSLFSERIRGEIVTYRIHKDFGDSPKDFSTVYDIQKATAPVTK